MAEAIRKAAESVIKAGLNFGLKATALTIPGGQIYETGAKEAIDLLEGLFHARDLECESVHDPDPVSEMGKRFAELVRVLLAKHEVAPNARLLICVDDLDRCLPHRQVALLEALHFLVSAGAQATILVALDPTLARQSVIAHYGTNIFDPERYLDKMFDVRITLPALSGDVLSGLIQKLLACSVDFKGTKVSYSEIAEVHCGSLFPDVEAAFRETLFLPEFCNPRMIKRILQRIRLLASSDVSFEIEVNPNDSWLLVLWLALIERRPEFRAALQDAATLKEKGQRLEKMRTAYTFETWVKTRIRRTPPAGSTYGYSEPEHPPISEVQAENDSDMRAIGMPTRKEAADFVRVIQKLRRLDRPAWQDVGHWTTLAHIFSSFDDMLVQAGL